MERKVLTFILFIWNPSKSQPLYRWYDITNENPSMLSDVQNMERQSGFELAFRPFQGAWKPLRCRPSAVTLFATQTLQEKVKCVFESCLTLNVLHITQHYWIFRNDS
ncbi:hypothetical protein KIN20_003480 [Parelaphostrongylus tenuis]|uniref:Uncharacterized protein n=1 Tax=Parelaphostrongylus tenuis TaxID=148309 RepID=A0AAD5MPZ7_PARTN|nr:hypothetical protein KIN20_003480 [Parelaphostrongylus tenuis]